MKLEKSHKAKAIKTAKNLDAPYSVDAGNVYFDGKLMIDDGIKADPKTFRKIKEYRPLYCDKNFVYCYGKRIPGSDVKTFKVLDLWPYCIDKNHFYYENHVIGFVDVKTLKILKGNRAVDRNHVYHLYDDLQWLPEDLNKLIDNRIDAKSFKLIDKEGWYVKDKNAVYYADSIIPEADPKTFRLIGKGMAEDKKNRFKGGNIIE